MSIVKSLKQIARFGTPLDLLLLFLLCMRVVLWFWQPYILMQGDSVWPHAFGGTTLAWDGSQNGGLPNLQPLASTLLVAFFSFFRYVGFSDTNSLKAYIVVSLFFLASATYFLAKEFANPKSNKRLAGFVSALAISFSPILFIYGTESVWGLASGTEGVLAFAAMIAGFAVFVRGLKNGRSLHYGAAIGLISIPLLATYPGIEFAVLLMGLMVSYIFLLFLEDRKRLWSAIKLLLVSIFTSFLANAWWLLPQSYYVNLGSQILANRPIYSLVTTLNIFDSLRLTASWGFSKLQGSFGLLYIPYAPSYYSNVILVLCTTLVPILAFMTVLLSRDRKSIYLVLISLIGVFLAKGNGKPAGSFFAYLLHFPIFSLFDNPTFFLPLIVVTYSVLIGILATTIVSKIRSNSIQKNLTALTVVVVFILLLPILIGGWPLVTGAVVTNWYNPSERGLIIPSYYAEANQFFNSVGGDFRIMILPYLPSYISTSWHYEGTIAFYWWYAFTKPLVVSSSYFNAAETKLINQLYSGILTNNSDALEIMTLLNIRYVVFDNSIDNNTYSTLPPIDFTGSVNFLEHNNNLDFVHQFGQLKVFQVRSNYGLFYGSTNVGSIQALENGSNIASLTTGPDMIFANYPAIMNTNIFRNSTAQPNIEYKHLSGTSYEVSVMSENPFILAFSSTFEPWWIASYANGTRLTHIEVNGYANGWEVEPGTHKIIVRYTPDSLDLVGVVLSIAGYLCLTSYLVILNPRSSMVINKFKRNFCARRSN
jgi:hypothetical protein